MGDAIVSGEATLAEGRVARLERWARRLLAHLELLDVVGVGTLLIVLIYANEAWYLRLPASALAALGILVPRARQSARFWWALTALLAVCYTRDWDIWLVNHKYMMTYWCLAMACARSTSEPEAALRKHASLLLGACFAIATAWKVGSEEFRSGDFFHFVFLSDTRFLNVAELLGGLSPHESAQNLAAIEALLDPLVNPSQAMPLIDTPRLVPMAQFMTWWTILIEGAIAALFLAPHRGRRFELARHGVLLTFLVSTFPIATVQGFAGLLALFGLARCAKEEAPLPALGYLTIFVALPLFDIPFAQLLRGLF